MVKDIKCVNQLIQYQDQSAAETYRIRSMDATHQTATFDRCPVLTLLVSRIKRRTTFAKRWKRQCRRALELEYGFIYLPAIQ